MDPSEDDLDAETFNTGPEEFDAFNDDTFGASADTWNEDAHEELAKITEEEMQGLNLQTDNAFFELDDNGADFDDGDCLETPGAETLNGDQALESQLESLSVQDDNDFERDHDLGSPVDPAILNAVQKPLQQQRPPVDFPPAPPRPSMIPQQPPMTNVQRQAPMGTPEFVDPAIMSMGSMPLPPRPQMFPPPPVQVLFNISRQESFSTTLSCSCIFFTLVLSLRNNIPNFRHSTL